MFSQIVDEVTKQNGPLIHHLTRVSKEVLEEEIKKAMDEEGITEQEEALHQEEEEIKKLREHNNKSDGQNRELEQRLAEQKKERA